jgi:hypothetical protein
MPKTTSPFFNLDAQSSFSDIYEMASNTNPTKCDQADVAGMCLLLRLGELKEVWMGQERTQVRRPAVGCIAG